MLIVTLKKEETVMVGNTEVTVHEIHENKIRLRILSNAATDPFPGGNVMLIVTLETGETVLVGNTEVTVHAVYKRRIRLRILSTDGTVSYRKKVYDKIKEQEKDK